MLLGLELKTWLGLSVLGAVISTTGSLLGIAIKDYFLVRSFEQWKQHLMLNQVYQRFRDPLALSALELASRIIEILDHYPTVYLSDAVLNSRPERQIENSIDDPYFQHYKLISTVYRLSTFLAWLELYRSEITFLRSGDNKHTRALEKGVQKIRSDLADGQLNQAPDWDEWKDTLIFREELRAVGESTIETSCNNRIVMGYGRYCELLDDPTTNPVRRWSPVVLNFLLDLETHGRDFRQTRLKRLFVHLVELLELLKYEPLEPYLIEAYRRLRQEVSGS